MPVENYLPHRGIPGELRVSINLSEYGDRAWLVLKGCEAIGFGNLEFATRTRASGIVEIWAIVLREFHPYDANTNAVVDRYDAQIDNLRRFLGESHQFNLVVLMNFREYLELQTA